MNVFSKRDREGYLLIDHRDSPGFTDAESIAAGRGLMPVGRGSRLEAPTMSCSHCQRIVVMNPDRVRARAYCPKCDHYVCDWCEAERVRTGVCKPFKQVIDEFINAAAKGAT